MKTLPLLLLFALPWQSAIGATSTNKPRAFAIGLSGANAELNGARITSGATLFPGDVVRLGTASSVALQFGKSVVLAVPQTELVVESEGITLRNGGLQIRASGTDVFAVSGPFFRVNVTPSGSAPGSAEIQVGGRHAEISAVAGVAEVTAEGNITSYELHAGETATLDVSDREPTAAQGAAIPTAGKVSRLLPEVQIERASQQLTATASAAVFWNDDLHSGPTGRAHITLTDGSQLNLGSNSSLRILQHDAQAQQTSLDLVMGRMRGRVMKLTRPGAKFEIRTPLGVIGLVGTDFSLLVTTDYVELMVFEGVVRFTVSADGQASTIGAGQKLRISRNASASGPLPASPEEIQIAKDLTDISGRIGRAGTVLARNSPKVPIVVTISTGAGVTAISGFLVTREPGPMSPSTLSGIK